MIEDYIDNDGEHRWRGVAGNGRIVGAASQGFHDRAESDANKRRLLGMLVAWSVNKGRDPDTFDLAVSTALGDIEVTLRVPRSVRESWDDLGARVALQTLAAQLAQFDPRAPQHVDDQATTNPIDLTKE